MRRESRAEAQRAHLTEEPSPPGYPSTQSLRKRVIDPGHIGSE
ncbi:MAG: hypothetical protein N2235_22905 [Fischerella sp.]|nr:hypothetical protein [Fischerella sp.]